MNEIISVKPRIDRSALNAVVVKAGLSVNLDVKVIGEPPPEVQWFFKDAEVVSDENLRIDNVDYNTKFFIMRAKRPQSGKYVIVAKNRVGEDRAEVDITILGKPATPKGPLNVSDVSKHGCKLKWEAPEDDGGTPIEYYQVEKLDPLTGQWVPCARSNKPEATITGKPILFSRFFMKFIRKTYFDNFGLFRIARG